MSAMAGISKYLHNLLEGGELFIHAERDSVIGIRNVLKEEGWL